jgi:activating signal cointegrator complex subunit 1
MSLRDEAVTRAVEFLREIRLREVLEQAKVAAASSVTPAARAMGVDDTGAAAAASSSSSTRSEDTDGLYITLRGLSAMQSPSKTTVLYAPPVDSGLLLRRFCELLKAKFVAAELMTPEDRPLLLHATVVNTIYVKGNHSRGGARGGRGGRERLTIDARDLVDRYEDYVWLENMKVEKVRICRMGAKKVEDGEVEGDEAYEVEGEVTF